MARAFAVACAVLALAAVAHAEDAPAPPPAWQNRDTAVVEALDKVDARSTDLTIPVGQTAQFGALTIQVQACVVRPPDQAPDSAAFLVVTDPRPGAPGFRGWMFASAPAASMMEDPIYDVRVMSCR
jgi:hypothetical protein